MEVAQIAKSIAIRLNATEGVLRTAPIDLDLVETAALAHDLGHPPFGHNGEEALDECMRNLGGFEGNAQTLRIVAKLEKKQSKVTTNGEHMPIVGGVDQRAGLNLAYRTMAAVLKYDRQIPRERIQREPEDRDGPMKGYYQTEADLVAAIKEHVGAGGSEFRTIECSIMDVADDIAYSTYDLEDSFKAGFLKPLSMVSAPPRLLEKVAATVSKRLKKHYPRLPPSEQAFSQADVSRVLLDVFTNIFGDAARHLGRPSRSSKPVAVAARISTDALAVSDDIASDGYLRTQFTADLVGRFVRGVVFVPDHDQPALSRVSLGIDLFKQVEVLKNFAYQSLILSPMLTVPKYRGKEMVKRIFEALADEEGHMLMPDDFRDLYEELRDNEAERRRVICDFVAGMTDRYAVQFYRRLFGTDPESIHLPL